ncbi:hypothetical protein HMPREF9447_03787 [Bacteroides oleiciplenus YIT 12058]|uniref:Uncharacterized protein n=1 Tax=Bacteroides oleiciplenus YIT 12058 TaxID=742727 RepID=K9DWV6_9BACE|nr:hypothetical protein HMPREF9447_03787 [Bacteroides oleiciplenus YIT 12058]
MFCLNLVVFYLWLRMAIGRIRAKIVGNIRIT